MFTLEPHRPPSAPLIPLALQWGNAYAALQPAFTWACVKQRRLLSFQSPHDLDESFTKTLVHNIKTAAEREQRQLGVSQRRAIKSGRPVLCVNVL